MIDAFGNGFTFAAVFVLMTVSLALLFSQRHRMPARGLTTTARRATDPFELLRHADVRAVLIVSGLISMAWDMQSF